MSSMPVELLVSRFLSFSPGKIKAAKAAGTVLSNMFQYKKLHGSYKEVRKFRRVVKNLPGPGLLSVFNNYK